MSDTHWKIMTTWQEELRRKHGTTQIQFASPSNPAFTNCQQPPFSNQDITNWRQIVNERIPKKKRKRTRVAFSEVQIACLEAEFQKGMYLESLRRRELSEYLGLSEENVKVWFQNKRMREKKETLKIYEEEEATDLRISQPVPQQLTKLRQNFTGNQINYDDTGDDDTDDEQRLQIVVNPIQVGELKMRKDSSHIERSPNNETGMQLCKLTSINIPEDITYSTDSQPSTSGINLKTKTERQLQEIVKENKNQVELRPHVFYSSSDKVSMESNESDTFQPSNIIKSEVEPDTCSDNSWLSSDNAPMHSPQKPEIMRKDFPSSPSECYKYYSRPHRNKSYSTLSLPTEFQNRPGPSVPDLGMNPNLDVCKGPFAPSPNCKCGCHKLGFLTYPFSYNTALTPPRPQSPDYYTTSNRMPSQKDEQ